MKILYYILFLVIFNPILLKDKRDIHYPTYASLFMPTKLGTLSLKSHFIRSAPGDYVNTEEGYPTKALEVLYGGVATPSKFEYRSGSGSEYELLECQ